MTEEVISAQPEPAENLHPELGQHRDPFVEATSSHVPMVMLGETVTAADSARIRQNILASDLPPDEKVRRIQTLEKGGEMQYPHHDYHNILAIHKPMAQFAMEDGRRIATGQLKTRLVPVNGKAAGAGIARFISADLGVGTPGLTVLWHSGFAIQFDVWKPREIFAVQSHILNIFHDVGRNTAGQLFSTDDVHTVTTAVDDCLNKVVDCSIENWTLETIRANLDVRDIPLLLAGALACMYPDGYPFVRECMNFGNGCNYTTVVKDQKIAHLLFNRIVWIDLARFNRTMRRQLLAEMRSVKVEDVVKYRDMVNGTDRQLGPINDIGKALYHLIPRFPMYEEYRTEGRLWVADIEESVNQAMEVTDVTDRDNSRAQRVAYLNQQIEELRGQRNLSYIRALVIKQQGEEDILVDGREELTDALAEFSKNPTIAKNINSLIEGHKVNNYFAFTGIPNYACPECQKSQLPANAPRPSLIPFNVLECFFGIMGLRPYQLS